MKKYPIVLRKQTGHTFRKTCQWCSGRTPYAVEVQWSYMRGDDDVIKLCESCQARLSDKDILDMLNQSKQLPQGERSENTSPKGEKG